MNRPKRASRATGKARPSGEPREDGTKNGVPPCRLRERPRIPEKRGDASRSTAGVEPVDEVAEGVESDVLSKCERKGEHPGPARPRAARLVVDEPEDCTVHKVDRESRRPPGATAGDRLSEHGDIRVVAASKPLVDGLLTRPCRCGHRAGQRAPSTGTTLAQTPTPRNRHTEVVHQRARPGNAAGRSGVQNAVSDGSLRGNTSR